jgi:hypothetical protein
VTTPPEAPRTAGQIRGDIARDRAAITALLRELDGRVHTALDWREQVSRHPLAAAGIAAGVSAVAAFVLRRSRRSSWERLADALADRVGSARGQVADDLENVVAAVRGGSGGNRSDGRGGGSLVRTAVAASFGRAAAELLRRRLSRPSSEAARPGRTSPRSAATTRS